MLGKGNVAPGAFLSLLALTLLITACTQKYEPTGSADDGPVIQPLVAGDWPLEDGNNWTFLRRLKTEESIFSHLEYQDYNLQMVSDVDWGTETPLDFLYSPYIHIALDGSVDTGSGMAQVLRGTRSSEPDGSGDIINEIELWIDADASRIRYMGENTDTARDSTFWDGEPFDWIRFGETRWEQLLMDYSGEENGMVSFGRALGLSVDEDGVISESLPLGSGMDIDLDYDTLFDQEGLPLDTLRNWPDSLISYSLVHKIVGVSDVDYAARFPFDEIDYFPVLADTVIEGCKWLMEGIEYKVFLTNQRNPDAGPGESGIPSEFLPERTRKVNIFRPRRLFLLAPHLGPIRIVSFLEIDWVILPEEFTSTELEFPPDFMEIDYLLDSNLLH